VLKAASRNVRNLRYLEVDHKVDTLLADPRSQFARHDFRSYPLNMFIDSEISIDRKIFLPQANL